MIDLHCHILPIDDGPQTLDESLTLIKQGVENGFKTFCCTSHYKIDKFVNKNYDEMFKILTDEVTKRKIEVDILKGNELYLTPEGIEALREGKVNTMAGSDYLLVEAIPGMTYAALKSALLSVKKNGYKPILAHVERYPYIKEKELTDLKENGVIIQINIKSLKHRKDLYRWIRLGFVDILASDAHDIKYRNYSLLPILEELDRREGIKIRKKLTEDNPLKIIKNENLRENTNEKKNTNHYNSWFTFIKHFFKRLNFRRSTYNS